MRGVRFERQIAELINDQNLPLGEVPEPFLEPTRVVRFGLGPLPTT